MNRPGIGPCNHRIIEKSCSILGLMALNTLSRYMRPNDATEKTMTYQIIVVTRIVECGRRRYDALNRLNFTPECVHC